MVDLRGGIAVPTFDFGDYRDPGPSLGGGIWFVRANRSWQVGAEADFGFHGEDEGVLHLLAKVGYSAFQSADGKTGMIVNFGAGLIRIWHPEWSVPGTGFHFNARTDNHFGVNGGAKLTYSLTTQLDLVASLQGDVAIRSDAYDAWSWPLSIGVRIKM